MFISVLHVCLLLLPFSLLYYDCFFFFFSSRRRHTRCALVTGVQTCALPIFLVFDRLADELFLIAPIWPDAAAPIDRMIDAAQDRLDTIAARLSSASAHTDRATTGVLPEAIVANPATTPARFAEMVAAAKDYNAAGEIGRAHV